MKRPFFKNGIVGLITIAIGIVLSVTSPQKTVRPSSCFTTSIATFQFAKNKKDIYTIFGKAATPVQQQLVRKFKLITKIDFALILFYGMFLFFFIIKCSEIKKEKVFIKIAMLVPVAMLGDIVENIQMLKILGKLSQGELSTHLFILQIAAWIKWGALSILYAAMGYYYFIRGEFLSKIVAALSFISLILAVISFLFQCRLNEIFIASNIAVFIFIVLYTFSSKKKYFFG